MIKKMIKQFMPTCLLLFGVFASCTSDDEPDSPGLASGISLRLQTSTCDTRSSVDIGTETENKIQNIHLWFFAGNALDTDKALFYTSENPALANSELVLNYTDEVLRLHGMNSEGSYKLFAVANLPSVGAAINGETTLSDLKRYSYTAVNRPNSPFCMTGSTNGAHNFSINSQVSIPLIRVASRLDITIVNASGKTLHVNKVSIMNDQQSVQLFAPETDAAAPDPDTFARAADIYTTSTVADEVKCSGYVYENRSAVSTEVVIEGSIDGNAATWTVPIKPDGSTILPRNSICKTIINLKGIAPTDSKQKILDWDNKDISAPIYGAYLNVLEKIVYVSPANGGVLHVQTNADSIQVNWENVNHIYLEGYRGETSAQVPVVNNIAVLKFNLKSGENSNFNEEITINADGLKSKVKLQRMDVSYTLDIKRIIVANSGYHLTHGMTVPGDFYTGQTGISQFAAIIQRNIPWYVIVSYYKVSDGKMAMPSSTQTFTYDGVPSEVSAQINVRANLLSEDVKVVMEFGAGVSSSGFIVYTIEFTMQAKS